LDKEVSKRTPAVRVFRAESDGRLLYEGPVRSDGHGNVYPVDERGGAHFDIKLCHARGDVYEVVDDPFRVRRLRAQLSVPLYWPSGAAFKTETFNVGMDVKKCDIDLDSDFVDEVKLCDGRAATVRFPMRVWENADHFRYTHPPVVVDVAAISPSPPAEPVEDTAATDALVDAASAIVSAARSLTAAAQAAAAQRPRTAHARRDEDGTLTVTYDDEDLRL
jgi:hypothetical protein